MSQVQVRQVPIATSTDAQRIIGSWFPSGYYGHFRARSRADLCNYFRQLARPEPPRKFIDRQNAEATTHMFSQHDNRFKFEGDPLVRATQSGFGKRRSKNNVRGEFDPLFVSWVPKNVDRKAFVDDPKVTAYAEYYNHELKSSKILSDIQPKSQPTATTEDTRAETPSEPEVTVYTETYRHGQPNEKQSKQIRQETYQRFFTTRSRLLQTKANDRSPSVASCLVWQGNNNTNHSGKIIADKSSTNESTIRIVVPVTLQPRDLPTHSSPRQRVQSAAARLVTTPASQPIPPPAKPFQSSSMQTFTSTTTQPLVQRPHTATTTSRDHFTGATFGTHKDLPPRAVTSFEPKHTNSMDSLISKYM